MHGSSHALPRDLPALAADVIARLRERAPRVHCLTNTVAQAFTANILLAAGAIPSMTIAPQEIADFAARADALLVNLGTFDTERRAAIEIALEQAAERSRPWVLDPVLIDVSAPRAVYARALAARKPAAIRLNAAEFSALAGAPVSAEALAHAAANTGSVIGLTGTTDIVSDGQYSLTIANGHPLMHAVTAMGCALREVLGVEPALSTGGGTSDGRFVAPGGAEVIELGLRNASIHKVDECTPVAEIDQLAAVYEAVLIKLGDP